MRFGTYYFLQAPPALAHAEVFRREIEQMAWTEELGFDSLWLTEHHFIEYGLSVSPTVLAAAAATPTRRVRLGLAAAILPVHDPRGPGDPEAAPAAPSPALRGLRQPRHDRGRRPPWAAHAQLALAGTDRPARPATRHLRQGVPEGGAGRRRDRSPARELGSLAPRLRRTDRRPGAGRGEGC